eukprot:GHVN01080678.1.p3 GENE.GHVN01080678.1~~GHVN01080678.1.p3  ORF type:complete len:123 (-),score=13.63 GHVN01080678.1:1208-1576(-)
MIKGHKVYVLTDQSSLGSVEDAPQSKVPSAVRPQHLPYGFGILYDLDIVHKSGKSIEHDDYFARFVECDAQPDLESRIVCSAGFLAANPETVPTVPEVVSAQKVGRYPRSKVPASQWCGVLP